ncbi:MmcQ/YjbR family DNA-binding protein [Anaerolineales bacterium HSG24]|nr:MmcQ/YjbR family DNA-binding protein [Anaerolineales bacterium HSG24]
MKLEPIRAYLLDKKGTVEETPFGPQSLVFKVMNKMFALVAWEEDPIDLTLKCDPEIALTLRALYEAIRPGYYMNKKHWNTITLDGTIPDEEIWGMIDASYGLVVKGLTKAQRKELE